MKKATLLLVLVAFVTMLSAEKIDFSSMRVVSVPVIKNTPLGFAALSVSGDTIWTGAGVLGVKKNGFFRFGDMRNSQAVSLDKNGNAWVASKDGLKHQYLDGTEKVYTKADGLSSNYCEFVECDKENDQVLVGTDSGLSISKLDASGNPTTFTNALSVSIHCIKHFKTEVWAANTRHLFHFSGGSLTTYDSSNSPIIGECSSLSIDNSGNVYVAVSKLLPNFSVTTAIARFDYAAGTWSVIDLSSVNDSMAGMSQAVLDVNNQMWCIFPMVQAARPGNPWTGWLVQLDLATGAIKKSAIDGTDSLPYLDASGCGGEQVLTLDDHNNMVIIANGAVVYGGGGSAILPYHPVVMPKVENSFSFSGMIKCYNVRGQLISKNTFSIKDRTTGFYINYQSGSRTAKSLTIIK
jgi:hypothetical protein